MASRTQLAMKRIARSCLGLALAYVLVCAASVEVATQSREDPVLGTWHLLVDQSTYRTLPAPKSERRIYTVHPAGVQATITRVDAAGAAQTISYVSDHDSVEYPIVGSAIADDTISWLPIDPNTAEASVSHAGRVIATVRRVVSADDRIMTITVRHEGRAPEVRVYERVD